jgi:hypothetical protein
MCDTDGTDCSYIHVTRVTATTTGKEAAECIQSRRVCVCDDESETNQSVLDNNGWLLCPVE